MGTIFKNKNFECIKNLDNIINKNTSTIPIQRRDAIDCDTIIGYSRNEFIPVVFLVISIIGLILNIILIRDFISKINNSNSRKQSSMKKLFAVMPILDSITSIYWIISSIIFWKAERIDKYQESCSALSIIYFSVFTFEFIFINFILIHFRKISLNPIEGILKPGKNLKMYFTISVLLTLGITGCSIGIKIIGRSAMITCFINTEQSGTNGLIFLIPFMSTLLVIIQVIYDLKCRELFVNDKQVRDAYKMNSMYVLVFSLLHIPMFLLILISSGLDEVIKNEAGLKEYSFCTTVLTCSIPMITGIIRNCRGFTKIKKIKLIKRQLSKTFNVNNNNNRESNNRTNSILLNNKGPEDEFDWLEKHSMEFFMRDILLSVAHCISESKSYGTNIYLHDLDQENESYIKHQISFYNFKLDDPTVTQSPFLDVKIVDYAPKIFAYLRNLEKINIDKMAESFLPKNNQKGISESQGKSGSFFISTDDNQYMIKTLRVDEFDLIRKTFLNEYVNYITKNHNSLLCRIYGMYNIILSQGQEILIIVMRNVIGEFKDNIIAKYDLKGSTQNRVSEFDMEKTGIDTMKDLNFNEFEKGIFISSDNIKIFRSLIKNDSIFLRRMELMDYSLFLVKLTLSKEEANDLFGEEMQQIQEKEFNDMMVGSSIKPSLTFTNSLSISDKGFSYSNIKIQERKISIKENGKQFNNAKYYKQYVYPSLVPGQAYILAIIDYFQMFNFYKYVESTLKTRFGKEKEKISCVDPKTYSKRFINYFNSLTDIKHLLKDGQKNDKSNFQSNENTIEENSINNEDNSENEDELLNIDKMKINLELKNI